MKRVIIYILSCISFYGCENNKTQTPISELINLSEWDSITIAAMKDKMQLDTLQYIGDSIPPLVIDGVLMKSFDEDIRHYLKFREKEIAILLEKKILSNEKVIYIHEIQAFKSSLGFVRRFTVMPISRKFCYTFKYEEGTDSFLVKKDILFNSHIEPVFYYGIKYDFLTGIEIKTKITKNKKSQLSYEIIGIVVD